MIHPVLKHTDRQRGCDSPEEEFGGSRLLCAVLDGGLFGQVLGRLDGRLHASGRQEGGQVGSVRRDHDEREHPPPGSHHARGHGPGATRRSPVRPEASARELHAHQHTTTAQPDARLLHACPALPYIRCAYTQLKMFRTIRLSYKAGH